jgi:hypothetical protein
MWIGTGWARVQNRGGTPFGLQEVAALHHSSKLLGCSELPQSSAGDIRFAGTELRVNVDGGDHSSKKFRGFSVLG